MAPTAASARSRPTTSRSTSAGSSTSSTAPTRACTSSSSRAPRAASPGCRKTRRASARRLAQGRQQHAYPRFHQADPRRCRDAVGRAEGGRDAQLVDAQARRPRWIDGPSLRLGSPQRLDGGLALLGVEDGQRSMAILADGVTLDVDRRAAVGAVDDADTLPQPRDLRRTEPPDEVLLAQELEEGDVV